MRKKDNHYFTKAELLRRGWTPMLIDKFVPIPDKTKENPYYPQSHKMKLYDKVKIIKIEENEFFKRHKSKKKNSKPVRSHYTYMESKHHLFELIRELTWLNKKIHGDITYFPCLSEIKNEAWEQLALNNKKVDFLLFEFHLTGRICIFDDKVMHLH